MIGLVGGVMDHSVLVLAVISALVPTPFVRGRALLSQGFQPWWYRARMVWLRSQRPTWSPVWSRLRCWCRCRCRSQSRYRYRL